MTPRKKTSYLVRNCSLVPASTIWPDRNDTDDVFVLVGEYRFDRLGTQWSPLRSSKVVGLNIEDGTYETQNSLYRVVSEVSETDPVSDDMLMKRAFLSITCVSQDFDGDLDPHQIAKFEQMRAKFQSWFREADMIRHQAKEKHEQQVRDSFLRSLPAGCNPQPPLFSNMNPPQA